MNATFEGGILDHMCSQAFFCLFGIDFPGKVFPAIHLTFGKFIDAFMFLYYYCSFESLFTLAARENQFSGSIRLRVMYENAVLGVA